MGCRKTAFVDESTIDFPIFLLFFNTKSPIFPIFSILSFLISYFFFTNPGAGHPEQSIPLSNAFDDSPERSKNSTFCFVVLV